MSEHIREQHEQGEEVKKWLKDNGSTIVLGISLGLASLYGWQYYQGYAVRQASDAANGYSDLTQFLVKSDVEGARAELDGLEMNYSRSPYPSLGALRMAHSVLDSDGERAKQYLNYAAENAKPTGAAAIANIRLARLLAKEEQYQQALAVLDGIATSAGSGFEALTSEVRGDILLLQGKVDDAKVAYENALENGGTESGNRNFLQMKIDDLG